MLHSCTQTHTRMNTQMNTRMNTRINTCLCHMPSYRAVSCRAATWRGALRRGAALHVSHVLMCGVVSVVACPVVSLRVVRRVFSCLVESCRVSRVARRASCAACRVSFVVCRDGNEADRGVTLRGVARHGVLGLV